MNAYKKALKLTKTSFKRISSDDIEALAVNLKRGKPYGLNVHSEKNHFSITRYGREIYDCSDIIEMINITWAIVNFLDSPNQKMV